MLLGHQGSAGSGFVEVCVDVVRRVIRDVNLPIAFAEVHRDDVRVGRMMMFRGYHDQEL